MKGSTPLGVAVAVWLTLAPGPHAAGQSILDDIEAELGGRAAELEQVGALLSDPDPNRRIAAMELLMQSDDPLYRQRAREFGLFSDDPTLRRTAVHAIFDAGGAFRIEIDPVDEDSTNIAQFVSGYQGSMDSAGTSSVTFLLTPGFDAVNVCWTDAQDVCRVQPVGETIQIARWRLSGGNYATGQFSLDNAGILQGHMLISARGQPVAARIPLIE